MIILLGFPKSGTSSFQKLFLDLSYNSYHWKKDDEYIGMLIKNNKNNNKLLLSNFSKSDCITQMDVCIDKINNYWPQITDYDRIYYEKGDKYETYYKFIKRKFLEIKENINKIKL